MPPPLLCNVSFFKSTPAVISAINLSSKPLERPDVWTTNVMHHRMFLCLFGIWICLNERTACVPWIAQGAFVTASVKPICVISAGCEMWLHSCIAFSVIPPCEYSTCKSLTVGPLWWYKGPWIQLAVPVRGEGSGVTLTFAKKTLFQTRSSVHHGHHWCQCRSIVLCSQ